MTKAYEKFLDVFQQNKAKLEAMKKAIESSKGELSHLDGEYNRLILNGEEEQADQVFNRIDELRNETEKTRRKWEVLKSATPKEVQDAADEAISYSGSESGKLLKKQKQAKRELEEIREMYFSKIAEIGELERGIVEHGNYTMKVKYTLTPREPTEFREMLSPEYKAHEYKIDDQKELYKALRGERMRRK